jgi:ribose transport system ATP-binding protein
MMVAAQSAQRAQPVSDAVDQPLLEIRRLAKRFGQTQAVADVSLSFQAGEVHCLLGENGAGKSTIGKMIAGLFAPDSGEILIEGRAHPLGSIADARAHGIAVVFQELSVVPDLTVTENICLGTERRRPFTLVDRASEAARARTLLAELGLALDSNARLRDLSAAARQQVEIVKALALDPRIIVLDEPTAMLGMTERSELLALVRRLKEQGRAIVYVTHHIDEVIQIADRVSILKDGALVASFDMTPDIDAETIMERLAGKRAAVEKQALAARAGQPLLVIDGLPGGTAITIHAGEIVGLYGVVGCGRERIAEAIVGLDRSGELTLKGRAYNPSSPRDAATHSIAYLPAGRAQNGILPGRAIAENLMLTQLGRVARFGVLSETAQAREVVAQLSRLRASYRDQRQPITSLSGGNQQKVLLGRCLGAGAELVVLEDPTAGVDIAAKHDIHELIREKARAGLAVLLVSSDLEETIALSDAVYTMFAGRLVSRYDDPQPSDEPAIVADVLDSAGEAGDDRS